MMIEAPPPNRYWWRSNESHSITQRGVAVPLSEICIVPADRRRSVLLVHEAAFGPVLWKSHENPLLVIPVSPSAASSPSWQ